MRNLLETGAQWIWLAQTGETVNQYVEFRHEFNLPSGTLPGGLYISVDTEYAVWLNGEFAGFNQYDDYPWRKSYDALDVGALLRPGRNVLCVLAYSQGRNSFQYMKGRAGLIYALEAGNTVIASGSGVRCRLSKAYRSGEVENVSPQLSFSFRYDARGDDGWRSLDYHGASAWADACTVGGMEAVELYPRPNKKLALEAPVEATVTAQGFFRRIGQPENGLTTAERMQGDYLSARRADAVFDTPIYGNDPRLPSEGLAINPPPEGDDGAYLLVDLGREEAGLFTLDIDASEGTVVDAAYGEQLDDLRVRAWVGGRNFAFSCVCKEGRQQFTHWFKRIAGRYVQLHIHGYKKGAMLYYAGMIPSRYPLQHRGSFSCGDRLFNKIHDISRRTLELCMHEHYEDTPWREQALYAMDSRNQALCGYYCFGEYDFPESAFSLFAENIGEDGFMEICAPARDRITIPTFSMAWVMAIRDLVLFSGRVDTAARLLPATKIVLDACISRMEGGLMKTPEGGRYWNFYEWADGLDDGMIFSDPSGREKGRLDAPLNLFFIMALEAGAKLAAWAGDPAAAVKYAGCTQDVKKAFHPAFWDDQQMVYRTYRSQDAAKAPHYAELTQALALCCGAVPGKLDAGVRAKLAKKGNGLVPTTLSYALYKYEALMQEPEKYAGAVFEDIADQWGHMLYHGATSFWETIKGADDFGKAGSLSHGWSAVPLYFFYAYLLGVRPLEPGFAKYSNTPVSGIVDRARGAVPTPNGVVSV